jgi:hypothetical protein
MPTEATHEERDAREARDRRELEGLRAMREGLKRFVAGLDDEDDHGLIAEQLEALLALAPDPAVEDRS